MPIHDSINPVEEVLSDRQNHQLDKLFTPQSIAIIGASSDPSRIGGRPINYCLSAGFKGRLYPVNPKHQEIQGLKAYPDLASIPEPVEFAILAVPIPAILDSVQMCGENGVSTLLIFSAGFSETGEDGAALQARIVALAHSFGMRVLGPNCLGLYNGATGFCPTFTSGLEGGVPKVGRVGLITQSGAYGTHLLSMAKARGLGIGAWVSTGNEADITVAECLAHLVESDNIDVIGCYMEGVNDAEALIRALALARELRKPVTILKVGVSDVGAAAAQSHTASLAGSDTAIQAVFDEFGVIRASTTEQMLDILYAASVSPPASGNRLGILTNSGGAGVLMADAAQICDLPVPAMPDDAMARLLERNPFCAPRNPVDVTAQVLNDFDLLTYSLQTMLDEGGYDLIVCFFTSWLSSPVIGPKIRAALGKITGRNGTPIALVGPATPEIVETYEAEGMLVFDDPSRAVAALGSLARFNASFQSSGTDCCDLPDLRDIHIPTQNINENDAKQILASAGINILGEEVASSPQGASEAAIRVGLPVALKIVSADIAHKSDVGGVALGLVSHTDVQDAAESMLRQVRKKLPQASIEGFLISPMAAPGVELIVGTQRDPAFGPMILVGLGGIFTEVLKDACLARAPVTPARAKEMLLSLRGAALLLGTRGRAAVNINAAANAISRISVLAHQHSEIIDSIEINPLRVNEETAMALDALVVLRGKES